MCAWVNTVELVPTPQDKYTLKIAELGEKKLVFKLSGSYAYLKEVIVQAFPLLEKAGGFELSRTNGPYSKQLVPIDCTFLTSVSKLKQFVEQARVYIRPLQADIIDIFGQPCDAANVVSSKRVCGC